MLKGKSVQSYQDLVVWQKAMSLVSEVFRLSQKFPKEEIFTLTSQIRRSAISIPSNIAEGQGKSSSGEFRLFLGHAKGSLAEMETQVLIAKHLNYLTESETNHLVELSSEVGRILNGLLSAIKKN